MLCSIRIRHVLDRKIKFPDFSLFTYSKNRQLIINSIKNSAVFAFCYLCLNKCCIEWKNGFKEGRPGKFKTVHILPSKSSLKVNVIDINVWLLVAWRFIILVTVQMIAYFAKLLMKKYQHQLSLSTSYLHVIDSEGIEMTWMDYVSWIYKYIYC